MKKFEEMSKDEMIKTLRSVQLLSRNQVKLMRDLLAITKKRNDLAEGIIMAYEHVLAIIEGDDYDFKRYF